MGHVLPGLELDALGGLASSANFSGHPAAQLVMQLGLLLVGHHRCLQRAALLGRVLFDLVHQSLALLHVAVHSGLDLLHATTPSELSILGLPQNVLQFRSGLNARALAFFQALSCAAQCSVVANNSAANEASPHGPIRAYDFDRRLGELVPGSPRRQGQCRLQCFSCFGRQVLAKR
jgi:hypothetical protein